MASKNDSKKQLQALCRICSSLSAAENTDPVEDLEKRFETLARKGNLSLVVLFGSYATGRENAGSDLDIAVLLSDTDDDDPLHTEAVIAREIWMLLNPACEIDLIILNTAGSLMKRNVANTGIPLYVSSPELWRAFRLRACREFENDARFRERRWQQVKRNIARG